MLLGDIIGVWTKRGESFNNNWQINGWSEDEKTWDRMSFDKKSLIIKSISMAYWENPPDWGSTRLET